MDEVFVILSNVELDVELAKLDNVELNEKVEFDTLFEKGEHNSVRVAMDEVFVILSNVELDVELKANWSKDKEDIFSPWSTFIVEKDGCSIKLVENIERESSIKIMDTRKVFIIFDWEIRKRFWSLYNDCDLV